MKKLITLLLALSMTVSLAACGGPSIESCVNNADMYVQGQQPHLQDNSYYIFSTDFDEGNNIYTVSMLVDTEKTKDLFKDSDESIKAVATGLVLKKLDSNTDIISAELSLVRQGVVGLFNDTKVEVVTCYVDSSGETTIYE